MSIYHCYQLWSYLESDVVKLEFESDEDAFDFWFGIYNERKSDVCLSIARLVKIDGVFHEEFIGMIMSAQNGIRFIKSHAL